MNEIKNMVKEHLEMEKIDGEIEHNPDLIDSPIEYDVVETVAPVASALLPADVLRSAGPTPDALTATPAQMQALPPDILSPVTQASTGPPTTRPSPSIRMERPVGLVRQRRAGAGDAAARHREDDGERSWRR